MPSSENQSLDDPLRAHGITIREAAEPVSPDQLDQIERTLNIRLPADYRSFLLRANGGDPEPKFFHFTAIDEDEGTRRRQRGVVARFYPTSRAQTGSGEVNSFVALYQENVPLGWPDWLLPIAQVEDDLDGGMLCIGVKGKKEGRIYYWPEQEIGEETLHKVADSFTSFLALLGQKKSAPRGLGRAGSVQRQRLVAGLEQMAQTVEKRDAYTGEHSRRVASFAVLLGEQLRLSADDLELLRLAAAVHDIGKIEIEDAILRKPGPLAPAEFEVMKTHTTKGAKILEPVPDLAPVVSIVRSHHERWDGGGYPDGLKGEDIPRLARIVAVANTFDAMVFDTPYRRGQAAEIAFAEIEKQKGLQFDPEVVDALLQLRDRVAEAMRRLEKKRG
jgi:putative nucleotidyltransferase with HDIG domain